MDRTELQPEGGSELKSELKSVRKGRMSDSGEVVSLVNMACWRVALRRCGESPKDRRRRLDFALVKSEESFG